MALAQVIFRETSSEITILVRPTQKEARKFKFSLRDDKYFNHNVYADIFHIDGKPVLHLVGEATNFQSAKWLEDMTSNTPRITLRMCWIEVYLDTSDEIAHDV